MKVGALLSKKLNRAPTEQEIAAHAGLSLARVIRSNLRIRAATASSLDEPVGTLHDGGEQSARGDLLENTASLPPDLLVRAREEVAELEERLSSILCKLERDIHSERNREIFKLYYGLESGVRTPKKSLEEVAQAYSVTRERIRQIVSNVWSKIDSDGSFLHMDAEHKNPFEVLHNKVELINEIISSAER